MASTDVHHEGSFPLIPCSSGTQGNVFLISSPVYMAHSTTDDDGGGWMMMMAAGQ
jgi:hypothetical protein